jgi:hypothetical protein
MFLLGLEEFFSFFQFFRGSECNHLEDKASAEYRSGEELKVTVYCPN